MIKDFRHCRPSDVKEIQVLKFEPVMLGRKWGGKKYSKKKPVWPGALVRMRLRRCWPFFTCPQPFTACRPLRVVATAPRQAMPTSEHPAQLRHLRVVRLGDRGLSVAGLLADRTRSMPPSEVYGSGFNTHHDVYGPRRVCLVTY